MVMGSAAGGRLSPCASRPEAAAQPVDSENRRSTEGGTCGRWSGRTEVLDASGFLDFQGSWFGPFDHICEHNDTFRAEDRVAETLLNFSNIGNSRVML